MGLLSDTEHDFATAVAHLIYVNPFLAERIEWERRALGAEHRPSGGGWHSRGDLALNNPNEERITERGTALAEAPRGRLGGGGGRPAGGGGHLPGRGALFLLPP